MNSVKISQDKYNEILNLFPKAWHDKLKIYTAEELFYAYKLCTFKPAKALEREACQAHETAYCRACAMLKTGDVTYAALRSKLLRYLKGEMYDGRPCPPIYPTAWLKLGKRFRHGFEEMLLDMPEQLDESLLSSLASKINSQRIA